MTSSLCDTANGAIDGHTGTERHKPATRLLKRRTVQRFFQTKCKPVSRLAGHCPSPDLKPRLQALTSSLALNSFTSRFDPRPRPQALTSNVAPEARPHWPTLSAHFKPRPQAPTPSLDLKLTSSADLKPSTPRADFKPRTSSPAPKRWPQALTSSLGPKPWGQGSNPSLDLKPSRQA